MTQIKVFIYIVVATVFFITANVIGGSALAQASKNDKFEFSILRDSLIKYLIILIMAALLFGGGYFGDEILSGYTTEYLNIKNLVSAGLAVYAINRAADASKHWIELVGLKVKGDDLNE